MSPIEAANRLHDVVCAIRDLSRMTLADWCVAYEDVSSLAKARPLSMETTENPCVRLVENLQIELQLRTAEFLLAQADYEK